MRLARAARAGASNRRLPEGGAIIKSRTWPAPAPPEAINQASRKPTGCRLAAVAGHCGPRSSASQLACAPAADVRPCQATFGARTRPSDKKVGFCSGGGGGGGDSRAWQGGHSPGLEGAHVLSVGVLSKLVAAHLARSQVAWLENDKSQPLSLERAAGRPARRK